MNLPFLKFKAKVKGLLQSDIPYNPLIESGDSSPYFGTFEGQRFGNYDTDCCWDFSATELAETRLCMLEKLGLIPQDTLNWLNTNGFKDSTGDYYLSREWVAILSGVTNKGNYQQNFWDICGSAGAGLIPNSLLDYNAQDAYKWITQDQFDNDYFNINKITLPMETLGQQFAKRFNIQAETVNGGYIKDISVYLQTYLKEGSVQIGIPVPQDGSWNQQYVKYPVGNTTPQHSVELYKFDPTSAFPFYIYDSYQPSLKQLSADYFIPLITRVSIQPVTTTQSDITPIPLLNNTSNWQMFWNNVAAWLTGKPLPYPNTPIGSTLAK